MDIIIGLCGGFGIGLIVAAVMYELNPVRRKKDVEELQNLRVEVKAQEKVIEEMRGELDKETDKVRRLSGKLKQIGRFV